MASFSTWQLSLAPSVVLAIAASVMPLGACGSSGAKAGGGDSGAGDAEEAGPEEGGEEGGSSTYPAFTVDYPLIQKNQAAVLESPVVVTVSWPGDSNAPTWEAFDDALGGSSYWAATTSQYGVGPAASGSTNHVRMTQQLPSSLSYTDLQNFVIDTLSGTTPGDGGVPADAGPPNPSWPAPTKDASGHVQTIYSLFIPEAVTVTDPGSGQSFCTEGGYSWHDSVTVGGSQVPYAVILQCPGFPVAAAEEDASHELVEAATDPYTESSTLGYVGFDDDHIAWPFYDGSIDEVADACQNWQDSYFQETSSFPYWVQRSWSNQAVAGGHDPCVPAPAGPYQGMTLFPSAESAVTLDLTSLGGAASQGSKGFKVTKGQPLTFQVGYFSDAPTAAWTIKYDFPTSLNIGFSPLDNGAGTVTIDKTSGQNGDKANVTVTVTKAGAAGFHVMAITWDPPTQSGYLPHYLPVLLVDQ